MARPKTNGYTPDIFDKQFIKILIDLQSSSLELPRSDAGLEKILGLTKGSLWKIKTGTVGVSRFKRDNLVKKLQLIFNVNPLFLAGIKEPMYNEGGRTENHSKELKDLIAEKKESSIMTVGDQLELKRLRVENKMLRAQLDTLQDQVDTQKKLIALYENSAKKSAK